MAYKKYLKRGGKTFGPYYYESYRDGDHIRKRYIGGEKEYKIWLKKKKHDPKSKKNLRRTTFNLMPSRKFLIIIPVILLLLILGFLIYNVQITGKASLDIKSSYFPGENITGTLKLGLKKGELLPINSKIIIDDGNIIKEFLITDFISSNSNGDYYVEIKDLVGSGEGFGFVGEKISYPNVFFELIISDAAESVEEEATESAEEEPEDEAIGSAEEEVVEEEEVEEIVGEEAIESVEEVEEEQAEEAPVEEEVEEVPVEEELGETPSITGEVVKDRMGEESPLTSHPSLKYVEGSCSKENDFTYEFEGGKTAEIKKNSVRLENNEKISEDLVNLQISESEVSVSTEYSVTEQGFGEDYLIDEKEFIEINLQDLGIQAKQGDLKISLVYEGLELAEVDKNIFVEEEIEEIEEEIRLEENITEENITEENITEEDIIIVNKTLLNTTLNQHKAVINMPVKWINKINIKNKTNIKNFNLSLPKQAKNITVKTGIEAQEALGDLEESESLVENIDRNSLITGQVSLELESEKGIIPRFLEWLKSISITGNIILEDDILESITETKDNRVIDLTEIANSTSEEIVIEYYTDAPSLVEEEIVRGKKVVVSADDVLNYTDVLAYTQLDNRVSINDSYKIKLYWYKEIESVEENEIIEETKEIIEEIEIVEEGIEETEIIIPTNITNNSIENIIENISEVEEIIINGSIEVVENNSVEVQETISNSSLITGFAVSDVDLVEENLTEEDISEQINNEIVKQEINFTVYDLDEDGMIDYIEWTVLHLSNQTYEIIYITKAEHLDENRSFINDIYDDVYEKDNNWSEVINNSEYVRVWFEKNLTNNNDITIYARAKDNCNVSENNSIMIDGTEVPCEIYTMKKRIDEIRGLLENE